MDKRTTLGFTLIELMITVIVIAILSAIAYPSYTEYVRKSRRADGRATVLATAQKMESYFTENTTYLGTKLLANDNNLSSSNKKVWVGEPLSPEQHYTIAFDNAPTSEDAVCAATVDTNPSAVAYRLCATPTGAQAKDSCGVFSLDHMGKKSARKGEAEQSNCW